MSHRMISVALLSLITVISSVVARADCSTATTRHVIKFYEYQGAQTTDGAAMFSVFRKVVDEEVVNLNASTNESAAIGRIATEPRPGTGDIYAKGQLDPTVSHQVLSSDPRLLELLDGRMQIHPTTLLYEVHSDIYVVPKPNEASILPISEDFLLDPTSYDKARSVHLAATYYALAIDAGLRSCRPAQVKYLSRAAEVLQDVKSPGPGVRALVGLIQADQRALGVLP